MNLMKITMNPFQYRFHQIYKKGKQTKNPVIQEYTYI